MPALCYRCNAVYDPTGLCPKCGAFIPINARGGSAPGPRWQRNPWGRIVIGLILAQGLFYAFRQLLLAILLAVGSAETEHALLFQSISLLALLAGSILAGSGQQQSLFLGFLVGLWNGILVLIFSENVGGQWLFGESYGQPFLHGAVGILGGSIGALIWKPILPTVPVLLAPLRKPARPPREPFFAGKIHWVRILAGTTLAVAGTLFARVLFHKILDVGGGTLGTSTEIQDRVIIWEIKALAVLAGGTFAGALTTNGLKQGVFVGLFAAVILIGRLTPLTNSPYEFAGLTLIGTFLLCLTGGWFGGQLFPPVAKPSRQKEAYI
jgi:hypothetical protein